MYVGQTCTVLPQAKKRNGKGKAQSMIFYHGSPIGGLTELKPFLSEHGKPYIYFATNPLVALLYAVKPVSKPFSFYPYGFDRRFTQNIMKTLFAIYIKIKRGICMSVRI